ncbi:NAD(P)H-dependent oxidoreductase, partial [Acinetobacter baumannii]|nr:NAD(P)H-dependent oxidoreductase [Acinetobacter baumannii]
FYRNQLPQRVQDDLAAVEAADALIVGTPVYRASFTGLFKHFLTSLNKLHRDLVQLLKAILLLAQFAC